MPNWCSNDLYVTGEDAAVQACVEFIKGENTPIDFNKIVPYPQRFGDLDKISQEWMKTHPDDWANCPKDGFNQGGYEWCVKHWGTKWPAREPGEPTAHPHADKPGHTVWTVRFDTAWSPPIPVIRALSSKHLKVLLVLKYFEAGNGFKGDFRVRHGRVIRNQTDVYSGRRGG